jgi:hypothetical protein
VAGRWPSKRRRGVVELEGQWEQLKLGAWVKERGLESVDAEGHDALDS